MLQLDQSRVNHAKPSPTPDSAPSAAVRKLGDTLKENALKGELENLINGYLATRAGRKALGLTAERQNILRAIRVNDANGNMDVPATITAIKSQIKKFPN